MHSGVNNPSLGLLNGIDNGCGFFGLSPYSAMYQHWTILIIIIHIVYDENDDPEAFFLSQELYVAHLTILVAILRRCLKFVSP